MLGVHCGGGVIAAAECTTAHAVRMPCRHALHMHMHMHMHMSCTCACTCHASTSHLLTLDIKDLSGGRVTERTWFGFGFGFGFGLGLGSGLGLGLGFGFGLG